jgi:phage tail sheath protein FI
VSLFAPRIDRIELLSDRTLSNGSGWRNAPVGRLMGQLLRLARRTGEAFSFEAAGDALFARIRGRFEDLLTALWQRGALRGERPGEAFAVRCDRALMSQSDLDNGRVICAIEFAPVFSVDRLRVELWLGESGSVAWRETAEIPETTP